MSEDWRVLCRNNNVNRLMGLSWGYTSGVSVYFKRKIIYDHRSILLPWLAAPLGKYEMHVCKQGLQRDLSKWREWEVALKQQSRQRRCGEWWLGWPWWKAGEGSKVFAWRSSIFIFEIKPFSLDYKNKICLKKTENRQNCDKEKNTHSLNIQENYNCILV